MKIILEDLEINGEYCDHLEVEFQNGKTKFEEIDFEYIFDVWQHTISKGHRAL